MTSPGFGEPPAGTVTFVFTDIEGSTQRVGEIGDVAWARLLQAHHEILREAFAAGFEVHTEGDGFFVVFASAPDAVAAAVAAQQALGSHPWPQGQRLWVRIGVHTGQALVREGDYVGRQVHRASRICDAAHGGQVLVSEATAGLVRDALPVGVELVDLGLHRLKDLGSPQRLFMVAAAGLRADASPRSLEVVTHNLPVQRSAFIGRGGEIARVRKLLDAHRLVTMTGVGGAGKTRLALQVAAEELHEHPDGVFFVDLAALSDPAGIARAVADALGLRFDGEPGGASRPIADVLVDVLARRACLLLVDNCEHLLDGCAELAEQLLAGCPQVRWLATSREPLGIDGEQVYPVPSLSLPEVEGEAGTSEAVELFVERARSADPDFELDAGNAAAVGEICRRLDGIPLAIEFAAARVSHLSVGQIATRLDDRFALLTGGRRRARHQQTLQAALDWSFELLHEDEQALLARLSVFAGSFTLERAEQVCPGEGLQRGEVLDLLGSLVDKSLVATDTVDGDVRYRLLETVRDYAAGKLAEADETEHVRSAHRDAYLAWLEACSWEQLHFDGDLLEDLERELPDLRAALDWSKTQGRRDLVARLAARAHRLWTFRGNAHEGRERLAWALAEPHGLDPLQQAHAHATLAHTILMAAAGGPDMDEHAERAIELGGDHLGGRLVVPLALLALGASMRFQLSGEAPLVEQTRVLAQQIMEAGERHGSPWTLLASGFHGLVMLQLGDIPAAERAWSTALDEGLERGLQTEELQSGALYWLVTCRVLLGEAEGAVRAGRWGLGAAADGMPLTGIFQALALAEAHLGQHAEAGAHLREALELSHPEILPLTVNECLVYAGALAQAIGDAATASRLLAAALKVGAAQQTWVPFRSPVTYTLYRHCVPLIREALDHEEARRCRDEGAAMSLEEALAAAHDLADALTSDRAHA